MKNRVKQNRWAQEAFVLVFAAFASFVLIHIHAATPVASIEPSQGTTSGSVTAVADGSGGNAIQFGAASSGSSCVVTALLVNPCRPWLGAYSNNYGASGFAADIANHEARIGRQLDVVHDYRTPGQVMSANDITLANRANTFLMMNWKPSLTWADATGCGSAACNAVDTQIDAMADSIKQNMGTKKIFLTIYHEPENDVAPGGSPTCQAAGWTTANANGNYKGTVAGNTTAAYVAMWQNVEARFKADGADPNVVWVMDYIGFSHWSCMVKDLWPGNSLVDWVTWDPYIDPGSTFTATMNYFYDWLGTNSDSTHDFNSKVWGVNEWGDWNTSQSAVYADDAQAKTDLDSNVYPKIKLWDAFDSIGTNDSRVGYTNAGVLDPVEQADYNAFANDPNISGSFTGPIVSP